MNATAKKLGQMERTVTFEERRTKARGVIGTALTPLYNIAAGISSVVVVVCGAVVGLVVLLFSKDSILDDHSPDMPEGGTDDES